jgi:hypothetical protein
MSGEPVPMRSIRNLARGNSTTEVFRPNNTPQPVVEFREGHGGTSPLEQT